MTEHCDRDIFFELMSIKKLQSTLQNKETTLQSYGKIPNQNTKKSPGIDCALFNCARKKNDNFSCLNCSCSSFYFYFGTNLWKKFMAYELLQLNLPRPTLWVSTLLAGPPIPLTEPTYFMDDPKKVENAKTMR